MCDLCEHMKSTLEEQTRLVASIHELLKRSIPTYIANEKLYVVSGTSLTLLPQTQNLELITAIMIQTTSSATLQLGTRLFTPPIGITTYTNLAMILTNSDPRVLTQVAAGTLSLELMGQVLPDKGPY